MTVVSEYTQGGIAFALYAGSLSGSGTIPLAAESFASHATIFSRPFQASPTFELSQLPALPAGDYTLVATGMNLAGATSSPAAFSFYLLSNDVSSARVHPNPWRSDQHAALPLIFDQVTPGATIKIFTVSAHWVQSIMADDQGIARWDLKNSDGERVQSGLYLYLATDSQGNKAHGKFVIIR